MEQQRPKGLPRWQYREALVKKEENLKTHDSYKLPEPNKRQFENKVKDFLWGMLVLFIVFMLLSWLLEDSGLSQNGTNRECPPGYTLEGYTTQYGETVTDCFPN